MLDRRAQTLLKTLIERYIAEGQPVGSRTLVPAFGTRIVAGHHPQRHVRSGGNGLHRQPAHLGRAHSDAQGLPPVRRFAADGPATGAARTCPKFAASSSPTSRSGVISHASQLLSELTHFAGVVVAPRRQSPRIRQIEFLSLSETRILLIIVTTDGDVQNRILFTQRSYSPSELADAANMLNEHFAGLEFPADPHAPAATNCGSCART